jgi:hypothetical protein
MKFKVFYWREKSGISPAFMILNANSIEDAIVKSDIDPELIYGIMELDKWCEFNEERRGLYKDKLPEIKRKKVCWAKGFFNKNLTT